MFDSGVVASGVNDMSRCTHCRIIPINTGQVFPGPSTLAGILVTACVGVGHVGNNIIIL